LSWRYEKGLHELGNGHYAYLVPDGSWGWSNAGLVADGGESLLVDTLFDLKMTGEMLQAMRRAVPAAARIGALVNTHANGDHFYGNQLLEGEARIIASQAAAEDMRLRPPEAMARWAKEWPTMGEAGRFWQEVIGSHFDFQGIRLVPPTETFSSEMTVRVGAKEVRLVELGPAHTRGDVAVYVPQDRVLYTGDLLFNGAHPAIWAGPVSRWRDACDRMLSWDIDVVVPGHGPLTDKSGLREQRDYLDYMLSETRQYYDRGVGFEEAAAQLALDRFARFAEDERLPLNVYACYREFDARVEKPDFLKMFGLMAKRHFAKHPPA
jgi:glyoxylase-like metal-dependent hydrolase (beta-lactamase superfamily II)